MTAVHALLALELSQPVAVFQADLIPPAAAEMAEPQADTPVENIDLT